MPSKFYSKYVSRFQSENGDYAFQLITDHINFVQVIMPSELDNSTYCFNHSTFNPKPYHDLFYYILRT